VIDGPVDGERAYAGFPGRLDGLGLDQALVPDAIAESFWQVHIQAPSAWTFELDLRPFKERF
jgi:hypothetical protein